MEKEVGGAFLRQILTDKDEAYVIDFNIDASLVQDYTRDVRRLQAALNKVKINTGFTNGHCPARAVLSPTAGAARGTVLYDAVYLSAHDMLAKEVGRKAMILLTDGEDEGSQLKIKDAIEAAQKADAIVYVLLCADRGFYGSFQVGYSGEGEMRKLTEATGGRVINVGNKFDKLKEAFDQIAAELRSQYNLGYTSTNTVLDGSYRKLEIKVKAELQNPIPRGILRHAAGTAAAIAARRDHEQNREQLSKAAGWSSRSTQAGPLSGPKNI